MPLNFLNNGYFAAKVGIGTDSPGALLEISGIRENQIRLTSYDTTAAVDETIGGIEFYSSDSGNEGVKASINAIAGDTAANAYMTFNTGVNTEQMRITKLGNVGIGTTAVTQPGFWYDATNKYLAISHWATPPTPAALLHLSDNANDIDVPQIRIEGRENPGDTKLDISVKDPDVRFNLIENTPDANAGYGLMIFKTNAVAQASFPTRGGFNFQTPASSSSLFITNEANVGIGTSSPGAKLDVQGTILVNNEIQFVDSNMRIFRSSNDMRFRTGGSDKVTIESGGNVGIGTNTPGEKLEVKGNIVINSQSTSSATTELDQLIFRKLHPNGAGSGFYNQASVRSKTFGGYSGGLNFYTNKSLGAGSYGERLAMSIDNVQNVGIGTDSPGQLLHLNDGSTATTTDANNMLLITRDNHSYIMFSCPDNKDSGLHFHNTTDNSFVGRIAYSHEGSSDNMLFTVSGGNRMNISHDGSIRFNDYGAGVLVTDASGNITATTSPPVDGITFNNGATITNQINTDVDTGTETIASVATATHDSAFFDFVIKKGLNVRSGTVYACHDGDTTPLVAFTETSTQDLGDTSDVTLSVVISGTNMELQATTTSDNWSVKSLIRAI